MRLHQAPHAAPVRLLIIPGLYGSGPAHWQTWLQSRAKNAVRVEQDDWNVADLERWSSRIAETVAQVPDTPHVAVAHSFGCLALAHHLGQRRPSTASTGIQGALFVAPAEPERFRVAERLPRRDLGVPAMLLASETDPWMSAESAERWARAWGSGFINLGDVGHINAESGFGPLPRALHITQALMRRAERKHRIERDDWSELCVAA